MWMPTREDTTSQKTGTGCRENFISSRDDDPKNTITNKVISLIIVALIVGFLIILFNIIGINIIYKRMIIPLIGILHKAKMLPNVPTLVTSGVKITESATIFGIDMSFIAFCLCFGGFIIIIFILMISGWTTFFITKNYIPTQWKIPLFPGTPIGALLLDKSSPIPLYLFKDDQPFGFVNIILTYLMPSSINTFLNTTGANIKNNINDIPLIGGGFTYNDKCEIEVVRQEEKPLENGECGDGYTKDMLENVCFRETNICAIEKINISELGKRLIAYSKAKSQKKLRANIAL